MGLDANRMLPNAFLRLGGKGLVGELNTPSPQSWETGIAGSYGQDASTEMDR